MSPTPQRGPAADTKGQLLDAAEALFAEHGIAGASLRAITARAGANLAAAHYHFGSKEGLARAVIERRLRPVTARRLAMLDAAEAAGTPRLDSVVRAFVQPALEVGRGERGTREHVMRLFGRAVSAPDATLRALLLEELGETIRRFGAALGRALPGLSREELMWRFHFMVGAMAHTIGGGRMLEALSSGACRLDEPDTAADHLVRFLAAGLAAPAGAEER